MLRKFNRILAFILAFALVTTTFGSDFASTKAYAVDSVEELAQLSDEGSSETSEAVEEATWEEVPQETPEETTEEPQVEEEIVEEVIEETSDDASEGAADAATEELTNGGETNIDEDATESSSEESTDAATLASSDDAASEASSEDAAAAASSEEVIEEKLVTVTYKAAKGGSVSNKTETVDVNDKDAAFEGSTATSWNKWQFTAWVDEDGNTVSTESTFVPADVEKDTTYTAQFMKLDEMPAVEANVTTGGMNVSVVAEDGLFPDGTTVEIEAISDDDAVSAAETALGEGNVKAAKGVDITFWYEGSEIQPADAQYVHVSISLSEAIEGDNFSVVHQHGDDVETIDNASVDGSGAEFDSNKFSVYVIASQDDEETLERKVESYTFQVYENDEWKTISEQAIKSGETLNNPGIPELGTNQKFYGWYIWENDDFGSLVEFGEKTEDDITADAEYIVRAKIETTYYVTFIGASEEVVQVKSVTAKAGQDASLVLDVAVTPKTDTENFTGWTNLNEEFFADGATIDASDDNNRTLTAKIEKGFWVYFDENDGGAGGGASYTKPEFVTSGGHATEPGKPSRSGYDFTGWYTDADCTTTFDFENTEIIKTTTIYAGWKLGTAPFTVIIWKQNVNDDKNASDADKTYDYDSTTVVTSYDAEDTIEAYMLGSATKKVFPGFTYRGFEVVNQDIEGDAISPKGTTVVNVYYDRNLITYYFYTCSISDRGNVRNITAYRAVPSMSGLYGQSISKYNYEWPTEREWHEGKEVGYTGGWDGYYYLSGKQMTFLSEFSVTNDLEFYSNETTSGSYYIRHYIQGLNGNYEERNSTRNDGHGTWTFTNKYDGFEVASYSFDNKNWTQVEADDDIDYGYEYNWRGEIVSYRNTNLYVRYDRKDYKFTVESVIEPIDPETGEHVSSTAKEEKVYQLLYEASLSDKKEEVVKLVDDITPPAGYKLKKGGDGTVLWADEAGTTPFDWSATMPASNNTRAYVVWTKADAHVYLNVNADDVVIHDYTTDIWLWYGDKVDRDTVMQKFTRDGYELVGWFVEGTNKPYDYSPVTEDVYLYAKWRKIGGVKIVYDEIGTAIVDGHEETVEGEMLDTNRDNHTYAADSTVIVTAGPTAPEGYTFIGWNLLDKDGNVVALHYPNDSFEISDDYIVTSTDEKDEKVNIVTLRALYEKTGAGTDDVYTTLTYNSNNDNEKVVTISEITVQQETHKIRVNEKITAWSVDEAEGNGFTWTGHELIGWNIDRDAANKGEVLVAPGYAYIIADNENNEGNPGTNVLYAVWKNKEVEYTVNYYRNSVSEDNFIARKPDSGAYTGNVGDVITLSNKTTPSLNAHKKTGYADGVQVDGPYTLVDGTNVINVVYEPIEVTVYVSGYSQPFEYDGKSHTVKGFKVVSAISGKDQVTIDNSEILYDGKTYTEANPVSATNKNESKQATFDKNKFEYVGSNYVPSEVKFEFATGEGNYSYNEVIINPVKVTVTIVGNNNTTDYNREEHKVSGYTVSIPAGSLYKENDFKFTPGEGVVVENNKPVAARTDAGTSYMNLKGTSADGAASSFTNYNNNFDVTFAVTDGYQTINKINASVTINGKTSTDPYDKVEHKVSGYEVVIPEGSLYTKDDFTFTPDIDVVHEEKTPVAKRTDEGITYMNLKPSQFENKNKNFETVTFTVNDGYQKITKAGSVVVSITGNFVETQYDGNPHAVSGYTVKITGSDKYTEDDFTFTPDSTGTGSDGKPIISRTDVGQTDMKLNASQFKNTNDNFENVTFVIKDGYVKITPVKVTVTITGSEMPFTYDGTEKTASGYRPESNNTLYSVATRDNNFSYIGASESVSATNAGTYYVGMKGTDAGEACTFKNNNDNFDVTFVVAKDITLIISPRAIVVTIAGAIDESKVFNGEEQNVAGYTVKSVIEKDGSKDYKDLFDETKIQFTPDDTVVVEDNKPVAKGIVAGTYPMNLKEGMFSYSQAEVDNFTVTFAVEDGKLVISHRGENEKYKVTITSQDVNSTYNGLEQSYTIIAGVATPTSSNPVAAALTDIASKIANFFSITADAANGDVEKKIDGVTYTFHNLSATATGKDVDKYPFALDNDVTVSMNVNGEDKDVTEEFKIDAELGNLVIDTAKLTITADDKSKTAGEADPTLTATVEGLQGDDTLEITPEMLTRAEGETATTYPITFTVVKEAFESDYPNYTFEWIDGTFTINAAPTPTPTPSGGGDPTPGGGDPTPTTTVVDTPVPAAAAPAQAVLGARREDAATTNGQAVLGARRAKTDDTTNDTARVFAIVIAAAVAISLMTLGRKKEDEEA